MNIQKINLLDNIFIFTSLQNTMRKNDILNCQFEVMCNLELKYNFVFNFWTVVNFFLILEHLFCRFNFIFIIITFLSFDALRLQNKCSQIKDF